MWTTLSNLCEQRCPIYVNNAAKLYVNNTAQLMWTTLSNLCEQRCQIYVNNSAQLYVNNAAQLGKQKHLLIMTDKMG